jgi:hypothetical protein
MVKLRIVFAYPGDRSRRSFDPPSYMPSSKDCHTVREALNRAAYILSDERERLRKTPYRLPALEKLEIIREDGSIMYDSAVRREAMKIML